MNEQSENNTPLEEQAEGMTPATYRDQSPAPQPAGRFRISLKFAAGFVGWYLVVFLIYWLILRVNPDPQGYFTMIISMVVFPLQILILIVLLAVKDLRKIGWGMLSAIGINMLISVLLGMGFNAVCFVPFLVSME